VEETEQIHLHIRGRVQGIFYRASARQEAKRLGLTGWVRNCPDGSVELLAQGPRPLCEELLRYCHEGPPGAQVDEIDVSWGEPSAECAGFDIRYRGGW
jgi:acylphosphatase